MEHIIIQPLENGYFRLTAEPSYELFSGVSGNAFSEAVVKEVRPGEFIAIPKEAPVVEAPKKTTRKKSTSNK